MIAKSQFVWFLFITYIFYTFAFIIFIKYDVLYESEWYTNITNDINSCILSLFGLMWELKCKQEPMIMCALLQMIFLCIYFLAYESHQEQD